eukprot:GEMP01024497.1.p1 GENE.GEMP01024497.1~~GEMP01024497.1.p1  ORF type:complete len:372 (+),score=88.56 GEMP01024497.1:181-1296(+)
MQPNTADPDAIPPRSFAARTRVNAFSRTKATPPRVSAPRVAADRRRLSTLGQKPAAGFENDGIVQVKRITAAQNDESAVKTRGGVVTKFGSKSAVGFVPMNPNKVNQDSHWELDNFANDSTQFYFGVADGHGYQGKEVSEMVRKRLPNHLARECTLQTDLAAAFTRAFSKTSQELLFSSLDVSYSGSTCVTCLIRGTTAYGANVGDSRAIVARNQDGEWKALLLSNDHKPDLPQERARIERNEGRVAAFRGENGEVVGPPRVWLKHQDAPGLAMSRSMGDSVASSVGVTSEPEIIQVVLQESDKFIILASDGVWEFITNEEAIRICAPYCNRGDVNGALTAITKEARARWSKEEEVIDDITAVIALLDIPA